MRSARCNRSTRAARPPGASGASGLVPGTKRKPASRKSVMQRIVILISGRGSNMQALLEARLPAQVSAVISNQPDAAGLAIAARHGVETEVVSHARFAARADFDTA